MVGRVTHNWLLKGYRVRNRRKSRRNSTGKYVSVAAEPGELKLRHTPHLAFFDEAYYDRVIAAVDERNAKYRRKGKNGVDTLTCPREWYHSLSGSLNALTGRENSLWSR